MAEQDATLGQVDQQPGSGADTPEDGQPSETASDKPEKTLTQAEVDDIVRKVKDREYRKRAKLARELDAYRSQAPSEPSKTDGKEPQRKDFEDYESFVAAQAAYAADQAVQKRLQEAEQRRVQDDWQHEQEVIEDRWDKAKSEGIKKYPDFEEVVSESDARITYAMGRSIKESEVGHEILYHFAKHPDEAEEIAQLPIAAQLRAMGRLEAKLQAPVSAKPPRPAAPPNPVSARGAQNVELSRNLDQDEWNRRWDLRQAEKARARSMG